MASRVDIPLTSICPSIRLGTQMTTPAWIKATSSHFFRASCGTGLSARLSTLDFFSLILCYLHILCTLLSLPLRLSAQSFR